MNLSFQIVDTALPRLLSIELDSLVIAGWAGRDLVATEHHIAELAAIGVPRPSAIPLYYRVAVNQLTQSPRVQVLGPDTSGEAEVFVFQVAGAMFVSLVSDHTDRRLETGSVAISKQVCAKPVATTAWAYDDVAAHWDDLVLRSMIEENGATTLYQEGALASLRPVPELIDGYCSSVGGSGDRLAEGTAMSCGTMSAIGGIRPARSFAMELFDPHRRCSLRHRYAIEVLAAVA
jgi:hypothetical protein